jgi:hypothetical protein
MEGVMITFPKGVRFEYVIAGALLLGSCDIQQGLNDKQKDEVSDIASAEADDALGGKVRDLDDRVTAIEQRLNM